MTNQKIFNNNDRFKQLLTPDQSPTNDKTKTIQKEKGSKQFVKDLT